MNNEPVAWAMFVDGDFWDAIHPEEHDRVEGKYTVPLYTAPQPHPAKTLTDEEIYHHYDAFLTMDNNGNWSLDYVGFANSILKTAREK